MFNMTPNKAIKDKIDNLTPWDMIWELKLDMIEDWLYYVWHDIGWLDYGEVFDIFFNEDYE